MSDKDVTQLVDFDAGQIDSECLPLYKCVCGKTFDSWDFLLGIYRENASRCPQCNRRLYFSVGIRVFEVEETAPAKEAT